MVSFNGSSADVTSPDSANISIKVESNLYTNATNGLDAKITDNETDILTKQDTIDSSNRLYADFIHDGSISNTENVYSNNVTSHIQTQLNAKQDQITSSNWINDGSVSNLEFSY